MSKGSPNCDFLILWRSLWFDLCGLVQNLGSTLSSIVISIFLTYGTTFILGVFNAISVTDFSWKVIGYLLASTMSLAIIFSFCDGGHKARCQSSAVARECILQANVHTKSQEVRYQVELILKAMDRDLPEINLNGFVTTNRPLFVGFASNTITYLIVLMQFKDAGKTNNTE